MAGEWKKKRLDEVATFQRGFDLPEASRVKGPFPVVASNGIVSFHNIAKVKAPGLIIGRSGSVGGGQFIKRDFWPLNTALWVKDFHGNCELFCYYLVKVLDLGRFNSGSGVPTLNRNHIHSLEVQIPPLAEQKAIAHVLGALDDKIENLRQQNLVLEEMARGLFKSWFVDFDPVRAKMDGRWKMGQSLPGLPTHLFDLFPDRLVEVEGTEALVPEGWHLVSLPFIADYLNGLALQKFRPKEEHKFLPVIKIAQLRSGDVSTADKACVSIKPEYIVADGDVLFSWSGSLEVEIWCGGDGALNQHLFKVTSSKTSKWFYYLATKHHLHEFRRIAASKATTMGHIQRKHLDEAKIALAPSHAMSAMEERIGPIFDQFIDNKRRIKLLKGLRDNLLPKLISGDLRISNIGAVVQKSKWLENSIKAVDEKYVKPAADQQKDA